MINKGMKHIIDQNFDFYKFKYNTISKEELEIPSIRKEMDYVGIKLRSEKIQKIKNQVVKNKTKKSSKKVNIISNFLKKLSYTNTSETKQEKVF